jgi:hypothetical protein
MTEGHDQNSGFLCLFRVALRWSPGPKFSGLVLSASTDRLDQGRAALAALMAQTVTISPDMRLAARGEGARLRD